MEERHGFKKALLSQRRGDKAALPSPPCPYVGVGEGKGSPTERKPLIKSCSEAVAVGTAPVLLHLTERGADLPPAFPDFAALLERKEEGIGGLWIVVFLNLSLRMRCMCVCAYIYN